MKLRLIASLSWWCEEIRGEKGALVTAVRRDKREWKEGWKREKHSFSTGLP